MRVPSIRAGFSRLAESQALSSDLSRATRATIAFMLPLIFLPKLSWPLAASFVALGGQNISTVDVRGAYSLRVGLLVTVALVLASYGAIGAIFAGQVVIAVVLTGMLTLATGIWRHLSADYGASISIASLLMLFLGLAGTPGFATAKTDALSLLAGGGLAILLHTFSWPIRPQYPLRQTVAESWLAAANFFSALAPVPPEQRSLRADRVIEAENALHATVDKTGLLIIQASGKKSSKLLTQLEALNLCAARLTLTVDTFNAALEGCLTEESLAKVASAIDPVLTTLTNTARSIALTVVSRNPGHLAAARIRLRRAEGLLRVLKTRLHDDPDLAAYRAQLENLVERIELQLPDVIATLHQTVERADERSAFRAELLDLNAWMLRPVAATLNLGQRPDPALIRYVFRLAVLTMIGVAAFQWLHLPHGYWLPFTMVVVLQPDFGATRQRAAQRVGGTLAGSIVATGVLWLHPSAAIVLTVIGFCSFGYAYVLRRNYGTAIFFVTIFVVLLLEGSTGNQAHVAIERVLATCVGGAFAFGAAALFWPTWERDRFPDILAHAFKANSSYLAHLADPASPGATNANAAREKSKRAVEAAHAAVFASLRRMMGDPQNRREGVEQCAALANGNQRLTRVLNIIFAHGGATAPASLPGLDDFCAHATTLLETLAAEIVRRKIDSTAMSELAKQLEAAVPKRAVADGNNPESHWLHFQCGRLATELSALAQVASGDLQIRRNRDESATEIASSGAPVFTRSGKS